MDTHKPLSKKRRYIHGRPVFEAGEHVEVFNAEKKEWLRGDVAARHLIAGVNTRRAYEYLVTGLNFECQWVGYFDADHIRGAN